MAVSACGANSAQRCKTISTGKLGTLGNITGDPTNGVCGQTYTYSIPPMSGATSYAWSLPSGATGSSSTNSITVTFSGGFTTGQICVNGVNGCGAGFQRCVTVNGNPSNVTGLTTSTPSPCMGTDILVTWNATNGASTYDVLVPVGYTRTHGYSDHQHLRDRERRALQWFHWYPCQQQLWQLRYGHPGHHAGLLPRCGFC